MNTKLIREKIGRLIDETSGKTLEAEGQSGMSASTPRKPCGLIIALHKTGGEAEEKLKRKSPAS